MNLKRAVRFGAGISAFLFLTIAALVTCPSSAADLKDHFQNPPQSARPWSYWFWINGNMTREGITADLEAMSRVGIGGVLIMEVANPNSMAPAGPVGFASPMWRELFKHVVSECRRLGMQVNMNNDAGWCGSGGPWITPEFSMQKLVSTNIMVSGPARVEQVLPKPQALKDYYKDVRVLALPADSAKTPVTTADVKDITRKLNADGRLVWEAPAGKWKVLRIGVTTTGAINKPAPESGLGLECDKFNPEAIELHFKSLIGKLAEDNKADLGKVFTLTHIDSWEVGDQDWTPRMAEQFRKRRGYDVTPWLPLLVGESAFENVELKQRFLWDFTRTKAELNVEAYAEALKSLAHKTGLKLSIEAYNGKSFLNPLTYGAVADLPMSEFWIMRWGGWHLLSSRLMASAGHAYGRPIIGAESFTAWPEADPYTEHPYSVKAIGDWAFSEGVNQFVFHRTVMDPWTNLVPGMTFAGFGWHVDRNQTWFEPGAAYMKYLARCQSLLQAGRFVADVCRLVPTGENFGYGAHMRTLPDQYDPIPVCYNYDYVSDKALLEEISVKNGRLTTRAGMSYAVLQLPNDRKLTPQMLRKLRQLVANGAVVIGPAPEASMSLEKYPECDEEIQSIARELWDAKTPAGQHKFRKGLVAWGMPIGELLKSRGVAEDFTFVINPPVTEESIISVTQGRGVKRPKEPLLLMPTAGLNWIHRSIDGAEVYFIANPQHRDVDALCQFRVNGLQPEIWNPETGETRDCLVFRQTGSGTGLPLHFSPAGSCFVVFRTKANAADQIVEVRSGGLTLFGNGTQSAAQLPIFGKTASGTAATGTPGKYDLAYAKGAHRTVVVPEPQPSQTLSAPWNVAFQPGRGAPATVQFPALVDWSRHEDAGVRYFSGAATYNSTFDWRGSQADRKWLLDLGKVQVMAEVSLNGKKLATLWKPPFQVDVSQALKEGQNELQVKVWNLWPNRLIGDEQFPDDCTQDGTWKTGKIPEWPDWVLKRQPRPEPRRLTFTTWKYYTKDSPLKPSGLLGPVILKQEPVGRAETSK